MSLQNRVERLGLAVCGLSLVLSAAPSSAAEPANFVAAQVGAGKVQLSWVNPESYPGLRLFRDGVVLVDLAGTATSYLDADVPLGPHVYALRPCSPVCPETPELGTHVVKVYLDGSTVPAAVLDVTAGNGSEYDGVGYLALGAGNTGQSGAIDVDAIRVAFGASAPSDASYAAPAGGWAYAYEANAGEDVPGPDPGNAALDGTWSHDNGSDAWDRSPIGGELGAANAPGGAMALAEGEASFLRIQDTGDPRDYAYPDPSNRKVYFTHDLAREGAAATALDAGVTLYFRVRVPTSGTIDPLHPDGGAGVTPYPAGGDGYRIVDGGKGNVGIKQGAGGIISFSLATEAESGAGALLLNNLNGKAVSGDVDTGEAGVPNAVPLDPTLWHDVWVAISKGTGSTGPSATVDVREFAPPVNLACAQNGAAVELVWENPAAYSSIRIFRNGRRLADVSGTSTSYTDGDPPAGQTTYQVIPCLGGQCPETLELGTHVVKVYLDGSTAPAAVLDVTAGNGSEYDGVGYLALGAGSTGQSGALDVDFIRVAFGASAPADASYAAPAGGWAYAYEANAGEDVPGPDPGTAALDGTWSHDNGSDAWDRSPIGGELGAANAPGGAMVLGEGEASFFRIQDTGDPRDYAYPDPSNRKVYLTHDLAREGAPATFLKDGVTLYFRARVPASGTIDPLHPDGGGGVTPYPAGGDGYTLHDGGKGNVGIKQGAGGIISFSLATEAESGAGALLLNNLNGKAVSGDVDTGEAGVPNVVPLDPTLWHDVWVVVSGGTGLTGPSCALKVCPVQGDTRCTGLALVQIEGTTSVRATASAEDDSGDVDLAYTFLAAAVGNGDMVVIGPQRENVATFELSEGEWTISVAIDDDPDCEDPPGACTETIVVVVSAGGLQKPGDANQDGKLDLSDAIALLNHLFLGTFPVLPCGDGTVSDPANKALLNGNGDGTVDLSDAVYGLNFLFLGGPPPVACADETCPCVRIEGCPDNSGKGDCR